MQISLWFYKIILFANLLLCVVGLKNKSISTQYCSVLLLGRVKSFKACSHRASAAAASLAMTLGIGLGVLAAIAAATDADARCEQALKARSCRASALTLWKECIAFYLFHSHQASVALLAMTLGIGLGPIFKRHC